MPLVSRGFYIDSREERPYEVETTYQLKYYVSSALISIDYILDPIEEMMRKFENKVQYYRYYVDGLFYFLGLINCRLPRYLTNPGQRRSEWDMAGSDGISRVSAVFRGKSLLTNKMRII